MRAFVVALQMCGSGGPHYSRPGGRRYKRQVLRTVLLDERVGDGEVLVEGGDA
jgi:hypothetical protein